MVAIELSKTPRRKSSKKLRLSSLIRGSFISFFLVTIVCYIIIPILKPHQSNKSNVEEIFKDIHVDPSESDALLSPYKLKNEDRYTKTLKSCTNINTCGHHKVQIDNIRRIQRIGIISPPSEVAERFVSILQSALLVYYDFDTATMNSEIELIRTFHVPPYGYGKNHGYTKIIRVMNSPLLVDVMASWVFIRNKDESKESTRNGPTWTIDNMKQSLMQIIRWHCRLSHVAAHTFMYNLNLSSDSILKDMFEVVKMILEDTDIDFTDKDFSNPIDKQVKDSQLAQAYNVIKDSNFDLLMSSLIADTTNQLNELLKEPTKMSILSDFLTKELDITNNLTKWPCLSFWDVSHGSNTMTVEQYSKDLAKIIVPDCSAPFTKCTVKRDVCEGKGDIECK